MAVAKSECFVQMSQLTDLKKCYVLVKKVDSAGLIVEKKKSQIMSREQKILLLPKKKKAQEPKKTSRTPASGKKDKKFQLKITGFLKSSENEEKDPTREFSPDSGFGDRGETPPAVPEEEDEGEEEEEEDTTAKKDFLDSLEDEDLNSTDEEEEEEDWRLVEEKKVWAQKKKTPKAQQKKNRKLCVPLMMPGALTSELSAYEQAREENIKERQVMFKALMADWAAYKTKTGVKKTPKPKASKPRNSDGGEAFRSKCRPDGELRRSTRASIGTKQEYSELKDSTPTKRKHYELAEEYSDYEEEGEEEKRRRVNPTKWTSDPNTDVIMPEDVTDAMINRVIMKGDGKTKVWNQVSGTTCHQCRQKTLDQKTICRSGHCAGGRGLFCGVCLDNRYGMNAKLELKNPTWSCPPCLGICNCSICRNRLGKGATGILINLAKEQGFESVHHYLEHLKSGKNKASSKKKASSKNKEEEEED